MAVQLEVMPVARDEVRQLLGMLRDPDYRMSMARRDLETLQLLELSAAVACISYGVPLPEWLKEWPAWRRPAAPERGDAAETYCDVDRGLRDVLEDL